MLIKSDCFKIAPCNGNMRPVKNAVLLKLIKICRKFQISIEIWINKKKKKESRRVGEEISEVPGDGGIILMDPAARVQEIL
jgi:hypothetical protein